MTKTNKTLLGVLVAAALGGGLFFLTRKPEEEEPEEEEQEAEVLAPGEQQPPREEVPADGGTDDVVERIREELERLRDVGEELTRGRAPAAPPQFGPPSPPQSGPPEEEATEEELDDLVVRSPGQPQPQPPSRAPVNQAPPILDDLRDALEGAIPILNPAPAPAPPTAPRQPPPPPQRAPVDRVPEPIAEGPEETVPLDTVRLLREMLPVEATSSWKNTEPPSLREWQRARGLLASNGQPDGKFGPQSALTLAEESSVVPIVRRWPTAAGANPQKALDEYRAALRALGRDAAATREQGQSFGRPFGRPDEPIAVTVTL